MLDPPVPVLMLYDPEEFWKQVRATIHEEIAHAQAQHNLVQSAIEKTGLAGKPAYTLTEIKNLFQLSDETLEEWAHHGLLRPTRIGSRFYVLYVDLTRLFQTTADKSGEAAIFDVQPEP